MPKPAKIEEAKGAAEVTCKSNGDVKTSSITAKPPVKVKLENGAKRTPAERPTHAALRTRTASSIGSRGRTEPAAVQQKRASKAQQRDLTRQVNEQLSYLPNEGKKKRETRNTTQTAGGPPPLGAAGDVTQTVEEEDEKHKLAAHLRAISPFNGIWEVRKTINEGTFGVVFEVRDVRTKTEGVIKVAKSDGNSAAAWEAFILEKIQKANPGASVVRILDKGMLADHHGHGMEFIVLEKAAIQVVDYLNKFTGLRRKLHVSYILLDLLKGIHDLHCQGVLHRDLKPDNFGIYSAEQPVAVLFDLGLTRFFTGFFGEIRQPRTSAPFRGTPEWASGHAQKGREQSRLDDLIAWMYVAIELYCPLKDSNTPMPWTGRASNEIIAYFKTMYAPARLLFQHCPPQFYAINAYLMTAHRFRTPDYQFLAQMMRRAIEELEHDLYVQTGIKHARFGHPMDEKQAPSSQQTSAL